MKSDEEIIEDVIQYFMDQDPRTVARLLAGAMIDYDRFEHFSHLNEIEKENFKLRCKLNSRMLRQMIKQGCKGDLSVENIPSQ